MKSGPEQLRDWMERREFNQRQASEFLGFHEVVLSQFLRGERLPGRDNAIKIEDLTGISVRSWSLNPVSQASDGTRVKAGKRSK